MAATIGSSVPLHLLGAVRRAVAVPIAEEQQSHDRIGHEWPEAFYVPTRAGAEVLLTGCIRMPGISRYSPAMARSRSSRMTADRRAMAGALAPMAVSFRSAKRGDRAASR